MTANQISYWNLKETERANRAKEFETQRSNVAKETETGRSNRAQEYETHRSNVAKEQETERSNRAKEFETQRANTTKEFETQRHNLATEISDRMRAYSSLYDLDSAPGAIVWQADNVAKGITEGKINTIDEAVKFISESYAGLNPIKKNAIVSAFKDVLFRINPFGKIWSAANLAHQIMK